MLKQIDYYNIEVLVNNAGYGIYKTFNEDSLESELKLLKVQAQVPVKLIKKVLPKMIEKRKGTIINVCSIGAVLPAINDIMYSATKAFMEQFTKGLSLEVEEYNIKVQALLPGFTDTDFITKLNLDKNLIAKKTKMQWMKPEEVVEYSLNCLRKKAVVCVPGFKYRVVVALAKIIPSNWLFGILKKFYSTNLKLTVNTNYS